MALPSGFQSSPGSHGLQFGKHCISCRVEAVNLRTHPYKYLKIALTKCIYKPTWSLHWRKVGIYSSVLLPLARMVLKDRGPLHTAVRLPPQQTALPFLATPLHQMKLLSHSMRFHVDNCCTARGNPLCHLSVREQDSFFVHTDSNWYVLASLKELLFSLFLPSPVASLLVHKWKEIISYSHWSEPFVGAKALPCAANGMINTSCCGLVHWMLHSQTSILHPGFGTRCSSQS